MPVTHRYGNINGNFQRTPSGASEQNNFQWYVEVRQNDAGDIDYSFFIKNDLAVLGVPPTFSFSGVFGGASLTYSMTVPAGDWATFQASGITGVTYTFNDPTIRPLNTPVIDGASVLLEILFHFPVNNEDSDWRASDNPSPTSCHVLSGQPTGDYTSSCLDTTFGAFPSAVPTLDNAPANGVCWEVGETLNFSVPSGVITAFNPTAPLTGTASGLGTANASFTITAGSLGGTHNLEVVTA